MCLFKVKHYFGHISGMVGPIAVKRKGVHRFDTGYNMWPWPLTSLMTLTLTKVKFRNSCISGIVGLIDVKWKGSELIWYWADCMTLPLDHTHGLDLGVSRSESEIATSQEWGGWLTWNENDVSHPFMTMILTSVTMVGWADVPDSEPDGVPSTYLVIIVIIIVTIIFLQVDFTYPHDFPFVPEPFRTSPRRIAFNQETCDPLLTGLSPSHFIFKHVCNSNQDCDYRKASTQSNHSA